ncbi:hypothetical protein YYE_03990 [Plasmodium vinckei vinckei]|uniref:PIR protein CIR protein n=1 Tax=Plasmodium vinckei vinckei TaxID=54757 RepID=A0A081IB99_PLAVN|nr:hypothetical protein YYE_03990 [Plasmodium vinckei vinckei]
MFKKYFLIIYTYSSTVDNIKHAYDKTVDSVTNAYTTSTNYISGAVNSITTQFNPFGTSQLGDNQSGFNSIGGVVDTSDSSQSQSPSPKSIDSQISTTIIQQITPTDRNILSQTPPSGQDTLGSSGTGPSITGSGIANGTIVKVNETPSI